MGKQANLPQIYKLHGELLFTEWKTQIARAEKATIKTFSKSNEVIQLLCDQLFKIGLIEENNSDVFSLKKET